MKHARKIIPAPVDAGFCSACDEAYEGAACSYCFDPEDFDDDAQDLFGNSLNSVAARRASIAFDERGWA